MNVVLDAEARKKIAKFNLDIYYNIEGIVELLFAGFSIVGINSVFITKGDNKKINLKCSNYNEVFQLMFEYKNEFYKDCIVFGDDRRRLTYEFNYNKENNSYFLKLLGVQVRKDNGLNSEIFFYSYGKHINVYYKNIIFSLDIQGMDSLVDFERFKNMMGSLEKVELEELISILELCIVSGSVSKIIAEVYEDSRRIKKIVMSDCDIIKKKTLNFKKGKC